MFGKTIAGLLIAATTFCACALPTQVQAQHPTVPRGTKIYVKYYVVTVDKNGRKTWDGPYTYGGPYRSRSAAQSDVNFLNSTERRYPDGSRWSALSQKT